MVRRDGSGHASLLVSERGWSHGEAGFTGDPNSAPIWAESGPRLVGIGPCFAKFGRAPARLGRNRSKSWSAPGRLRPAPGTRWSKLGRIRSGISRTRTSIPGLGGCQSVPNLGTMLRAPAADAHRPPGDVRPHGTVLSSCLESEGGGALIASSGLRAQCQDARRCVCMLPCCKADPPDAHKGGDAFRGAERKCVGSLVGVGRLPGVLVEGRGCRRGRRCGPGVRSRGSPETPAGSRLHAA